MHESGGCSKLYLQHECMLRSDDKEEKVSHFNGKKNAISESILTLEKNFISV